ncbi:MAG: V-type ATP synthase subunit F [Oscillospiraceae bacterium]|nr:V-type ATP synthase subunit F [Oscillospiraceae bacterium]
MYRIAVIGGADSVIGFQALGLDTYPAQDGASAKAILHDLVKIEEDPYVIIYLEETLAQTIQDEVRKYSSRPSPAIILIPGRDGPIGLGRNALQQAVEKAVGSNIL